MNAHDDFGSDDMTPDEQRVDDQLRAAFDRLRTDARGANERTATATDGARLLRAPLATAAALLAVVGLGWMALANTSSEEVTVESSSIGEPTSAPTTSPTTAPTAAPTAQPTAEPTDATTESAAATRPSATALPTQIPRPEATTAAPAATPAPSATPAPTSAPTAVPTPRPAALPEPDATLVPAQLGAGPFAGTYTLVRDHDALYPSEQAPNHLLVLDGDGTMHGRSGCVTFGGTVENDGHSGLWTVGPIETFLGGCPAGETWHRAPDFTGFIHARINERGNFVWFQDAHESGIVYEREYALYAGPVASFGSTADVAPIPTPPVAPSLGAGPFAGDWKLVSSAGVPLAAGTGPTISLEPDGTMTGAVDCSTFVGQISASDSLLVTVGEIIASPGPCGAGVAGNVPLDTLQFGTILGGQLHWSTADGTTLIFERRQRDD